MEVKCYRESGNPVDLQAMKRHKEEFQFLYDALLEKHGQDMEAMHEGLKAVDLELEEKYDMILNIEFPVSNEQVKGFLDIYGPYMVAEHKETGEVLIIIKDMGI